MSEFLFDNYSLVNFKRTLVNLYQSGGKSRAALCKEYGVSASVLDRRIKQYSTVETDDGEVPTAKQIKELQKRNAQLKKKLLIKNYFQYQKINNEII